jgi:hypothetical protein
MPRGYGKEAGKINSKVRSAVVSALGILDSKGVPLKVLLAREFERDAVRTLQAVARFLPAEARVEVVDVTALHLAAVRGMTAAPRQLPPVIDVTPNGQPHYPTSDKDAELLERLLS